MTSSEFELIAKLIKSREPVTTGARLVLLEKLANADAARAAGATPQPVHRSVKRFAKIHREITQTFSKDPRSASGRR